MLESDRCVTIRQDRRIVFFNSFYDGAEDAGVDT